MAMTLNEARLQMAQACTIGGSVPARFVAGWLEAVNAHLTQPAQAVDVGAAREVLAEFERVVGDQPGWRADLDKLTRALAGEQAGWRDMGSALVIRLGEVTARLEAADGLLRECLSVMELHPATHTRITTHLKADDHV